MLLMPQIIRVPQAFVVSLVHCGQTGSIQFHLASPHYHKFFLAFLPSGTEWHSVAPGGVARIQVCTGCYRVLTAGTKWDFHL
ncbi:hypothetical protein C8R42DRAFT_682586 [Lentinula raphanica]|nr:hypothetical protein C8R42DRAFT_682586 [Lentinula raphanica]